MANGLNLFEQFINWLYSTGDISVPKEFHERCAKIAYVLQDDALGIVNTILDYSISSASDTKYTIICDNTNLEELLNNWLLNVNLEVDGIPTGINELSKEYLKERWQGSSLCILRMSNWKKLTVNGNTIEVPMTMWLVNGSSVYVKRTSEKNYKLGSDKFYLDSENKNEVPASKEEKIVVYKPYGRWFDKYPVPYLVRRGILKNLMAMQVLQEKSNEVLSRFIPYLFLTKKGTEKLFLEGDVDYKDEELQEMINNYKEKIEEYKSQVGKTPMAGIPFDTEFIHLIPELKKIISDELYRQGYRACLAGLGFVDVIQGISDTRRESILNPAPFISELNDGVNGFKTILNEVIKVIAKKNSGSIKLFSSNNPIEVINVPLKINVERILEHIRGGYDRGVISIEDYQGSLGFNKKVQKNKRIREYDDGDEDLFYPHLIQNQENVPDIRPSKNRNKEKLENQGKKPGTPEAEKYKNAGLTICGNCKNEIDYLKYPEAGMGYIKCPICGINIDQEGKFSKVLNTPIDPNLEIAPYNNIDDLPLFIKKMPVTQCKEVFMATFNNVYEDSGDEGKAFSIAYNAAKRCMKKHGYSYDKNKKIWEKK